MRILLKQFLGKNHSWAVVGWSLAEAFISRGHQVDLFSTDGIKHLPARLKPNLIGYTEENQQTIFGRAPLNDYDAVISYTTMKNFPSYLSHSPKNRLGIWVFEWQGKNVLPIGFAKNYKACNYLCSPSQFGKQVFMNSGVPENAIKVIPHGITVSEYQQTSTISLPTTKRYKILSNIAQNHLRKNIPGLLDAYGKAFTKNDDVCLILKAKANEIIKFPFDVSIKDCLQKFNQKYPQHAEVKLFSEFVDDMSALYRSVDTVFTMTHCEGFYMPGLEAMAAGKLSIAPNWGGQTDFLNDSNALLIEGKETRANPVSMYWGQNNNAIWFQPSIDDAVEKLRYAYQNYERLNEQIDKQRPDVYAAYGWDVIADQFLELCR